MCGTAGQAYGTLATVSSTVQTIQLPFAPGMEEALTQVEISVKEPLDTTTTQSMFYAEVYLQRGAGLERILLDRGVVVGGYGQRNFVGMVGRVGYADGDCVVAVLYNMTGATITYNVSCSYETWPTTADAYRGNCQGFTRLSRPVRVFYTCRRVATQANAGGGAIVIDITFAQGCAARINGLSAGNSGTNGLVVATRDEDFAAIAQIAQLSSAAATICYMPSVGATSGATDNEAHSGYTIVPSGNSLSISQTGVGAQSDTLTIGMSLELMGFPQVPVWSKARSTNQADVTLAASTVAEANTWHAVVP